MCLLNATILFLLTAEIDLLKGVWSQYYVVSLVRFRTDYYNAYTS
jgi:hypothetical protein